MLGSIFADPSILREIRVVRREIVGAGLKPAGRMVGRPGFRAEIVGAGRFQTGPYSVSRCPGSVASERNIVRRRAA